MFVCPGQQRGAAAAGGDDPRDGGGWEGSTCCWGADMEAVFDEGIASSFQEVATPATFCTQPERAITSIVYDYDLMQSLFVRCRKDLLRILDTGVVTALCY